MSPHGVLAGLFLQENLSRLIYPSPQPLQDTRFFSPVPVFVDPSFQNKGAGNIPK